jgi:hypothetical protein
MTDPMADMYGQRQARTGSVSEPSMSNDCQSDDSKAQVAETARLQDEAQQRIDATRNPGIGSAP